MLGTRAVGYVTNNTLNRLVYTYTLTQIRSGTGGNRDSKVSVFVFVRKLVGLGGG